MTDVSSHDTPQDDLPHMFGTLAAAFTGEHIPATGELVGLVGHLDTCVECRAGLALLLDASAQRDDLALEERATFANLRAQFDPRIQPAHAVDGGSLAAYAEALDTLGEAAARAQAPAVAAHLDHCSTCRELVAATRELVAEVAPAADSQTAPLWESVEGGLWRLRERLDVLVGRLSVTVTTTLEGVIGPATPVAVARAQSTSSPRERLTFALPVARPGDLWLRVTLDLDALLDSTLNVSILGQALTSSASAPISAELDARPWPGVTWRAELLDGQTRRVVSQGATDDSGQSRFSASRPGAYELTISVDAQSWQIPFDVRHH